ncbi:MAG: transcriptional regulator [Halobacteriales archaeon SW_9_67_25]|nr:MAG: transcriptional regulator [Halobacteriales archaeon SW_9_67_25]
MAESNPTFSTGIRYLDMQAGGGVPAGDIVVLTAPPNSQSETIFQEFASAEPTVYLSTTAQDTDELRARLEPSGIPAEDLTVGHLDPTAFLDDPEKFVGDLPPESVVVVDPVDLLESGPRGAYLASLNLLKSRLRETDSVALLHCLSDTPVPDHRALTLKRADHIWSLRQTIENGELQTTLYVPKSRIGAIIADGISIELTDGVQIDTSRNIA